MATHSESPLQSTNNEKKAAGFKQSCPHCGKSFNDQISFRQHTSRAHQKVECKACSRIYENLNSFTRHALEAHNMRIPFRNAVRYANGTIAWSEVELKRNKTHIQSNSALTEQHSEPHHAENTNCKISASLADDTVEAATEQTDEYLTSVSDLNPKHQFQEENMTSTYPSEPTSLKVEEYSAFQDVPAFWLSSQVLQDAEEWYDSYRAATQGYHTTEQTDEYLTSVSGLNPKHQFREENMTSTYPSEPTSLKVEGYSAFQDPAFWLSSQVLQDAEEEWYDSNRVNLDGTDSSAMELDTSQPFSNFLESGLRSEFN